MAPPGQRRLHCHTAIGPLETAALTSLPMRVLILLFLSSLTWWHASPVPSWPATIDGGAWPTAHVQGVAVDAQRGHVYLSFTTVLVKMDTHGRVLGTVEGFTGHLGDLAFNPGDRRLYGSLEYKAQRAFYIAVVDVDRIDRVGIKAQDSSTFRTVYLPEVVADYTADMDGNGRFDGDTGATPDHRFGCSGIDGVSFGPRFGQESGKPFLTIAYGIYGNPDRRDNDHQVLLQYDAADWVARYARPLIETAPHRSGPARPAGKYFVRTGNTTYGVQNLEYDAHGHRWLLGVYAGRKPQFPNYTLFAVPAAAQPVAGRIDGTSEQGLRLPLAQEGRHDTATGIRGWMQKADVGIVALGDGWFYLAENGKRDGLQTATLRLMRWTGDADAPFAPAP